MNAMDAEIIIIGAGAAGLMAATGAASTFVSKKQDGRVLVLEKMPRPGRKIMITGKGRCNFTNMKPWNEFSHHIHPKPNFLKPSFFNLTSEKMMCFLNDQGLETVIERGDRAFPASHLASDVVDTLVDAATNHGAQILCSKEVRDISHDEAGSYFRIACSDSSEFSCRKLIICTGGLSYPRTGSTGDGYGWARKTGHTIRPLFPSLTAIVPKGYKDETVRSSDRDFKGHIDRNTPLTEIGKNLCGNQLKNINISIIVDGNEVQSEFGDLDFTDGGIEGPVGFKVSRKCVNALVNGSKVTAIIDLQPAVGQEDLEVRIATLWNEISKDRKTANRIYKDRFRIMLGKLLPMSLIPAFMKLNPGTDHKTLARTLKNWKMEISGFVGYERCVVTAGGISLDDVNPKTLESKLIKGLHFAGEVLDIDADTGGYNLQAAFSTGYLAGISAARELSDITL